MKSITSNTTETTEAPVGLSKYWMRKAAPFCRGRNATEAFIKSMPAPRRTDTWNPLSQGGNRLFGSWTLERPIAPVVGQRELLGFRHSLNKTISVGLCAGIKIMVCSNLQFSSDRFIEFRKHTGGLDYAELVEMVTRSLPEVHSRYNEFDQWLSCLADIALPESEFKELGYDAVIRDVLPGSQLKPLQTLIDKTDRYQGTLYGWYQANSELWKSKTLGHVSRASGSLRRFIDSIPKYGEEIYSKIDSEHNAVIQEENNGDENIPGSRDVI
jgi:hypothetical protein